MKPRKCKAKHEGLKCGVKFTPEKPWIDFCSPECGAILGLERAEKDRIKREKAAKKKERKRHAERKQSIKKRSTVMGEADKAFQRWIRYRDKDKPCINTGVFVEWDGNESDAAHFISKAANTALRYDLRNCHKSTKASNANQEKYIHDYRRSLEERIGRYRYDHLEYLDMYYKTNKRGLDKAYLERVKKVFNKKYRVVKKIREKS